MSINTMNEIAPKATSTSSKWYVMRVISTKEKKVKEFLDTELPLSPWAGVVKQIFLPTEKILRIVKGKKVVQERNYYPGYLMLEADVDATGGRMPDDLIDFIKNAQNVIHFLGKDTPTPLSKTEVNKMIGKVVEEKERTDEEGIHIQDPYIVGETVNIIEGPFNDFTGVIEEVSEDNKKLKVVVKIFGRSTPIDLSVLQVERLA